MPLISHAKKLSLVGTSRDELASNLVDNLITQGRCLSVSAPNNFGKSHFLRLLATVATSASHNNLVPVYIDCNLRADDSQQALYVLVLKELLAVFKHSELDNLYRDLVASPTSSSFQINHAFLTAFEVIKELLATSGKKRLVLVLDEFDQVVTNFPAAVFRHLRAIQDRYGDRLVYVTGTNRPLPALGCEDAEDLAEFYELFDLAGLVRLPGLTRAESDKLVSDRLLLAESLPNLFSQLAGWVYPLTGGHPGLTLHLAQLLKAAIPTPAPAILTEAELTSLVRLDPQLKVECRRIWNSLAPSERVALLQRLEGIKTLTADPILGSLAERGLIRPLSPVKVGSASRDEDIFSLIFEWFLREKLEFEKANTQPTSLGTFPTAFTVPTSSTPSNSSTGTKTTQSAFNNNNSPDAAAAMSSPSASTYATTNSRISFDPVHQVVVFESGKSHLPLTGNAALLFKYLFLRQSVPYCSKDELITAVWGQEAYGSENLDRLVSDLRQLIGDHDKQFIRTIHRRGLQMVGIPEWRL